MERKSKKGVLHWALKDFVDVDVSVDDQVKNELIHVVDYCWI